MRRVTVPRPHMAEWMLVPVLLLFLPLALAVRGLGWLVSRFVRWSDEA